LENVDVEVDINRAWGTVKREYQNFSQRGLGYYELKMHNPWFNEGCSILLDQRKQAKLQWLQDPRQINGDSLDMKPAGSCKVYLLFKIQ
jgi:hypothetical protein